MKENFVVIAESRADQGKGASRRLRREGKIPAIVYGGGETPTSVSLSANEMAKHLKVEAFYSHLLTLKLDGTEQQVVLKDLQRHPVSGYATHADFQRVQADKLLRMHVPLHFKGETVAPGVKTGGGIVEHHLNQVEVECLPKDLPEYIEVDLSSMQVNESIHLSELTLPQGVTLLELKHDNDQSVVSIHLPRAAIEEEAPAADAPAEGAAADAKKEEKK
ncbi:50S ribosomal protein L25/general stress protein Ctc [Sinimarinibacterium flocculans]|uniref:Large ribosomal subunit protein bL25 n=1 Tax=Sinimarinibacterium flocculans TaxID=985250 RepID=A0A318EJM3_9GAMM|nr:50S ribosomal protein L25/general stress protein Ctc [Sinimarinibacterium flocculans]PXV71084.1 LSU ribosomal protein L25P [Sinimarinibacterium flocculans]